MCKIYAIVCKIFNSPNFYAIFFSLNAYLLADIIIKICTRVSLTG